MHANEVRRDRAQEALDAYIRFRKNETQSAAEFARDLMVDLCHWWAKNGDVEDANRRPSVDGLLSMTQAHYDAEK